MQKHIKLAQKLIYTMRQYIGNGWSDEKLAVHISELIAQYIHKQAYTNVAQWKTIDSAPTEIDVLLYRGPSDPPIVAGWFDGEWKDYDSTLEISGTPTHWMPLPKDPILTSEE